MPLQVNRKKGMIGVAIVAVVALAVVVSFFAEDELKESERYSAGTMASGRVSNWQGVTGGFGGAGWFESGNWEGTIPDQKTKTIIKLGSLSGRLDPEVPPPAGSDTARTGDLVIEAGGRMKFSAMAEPGILVVHGSWNMQSDGELFLGNGILAARGDIVLDQGARFDGGSGVVIFTGKRWEAGPSSFFAGTGKTVLEGNSPQRIKGEIFYYDLDVLTADTVLIEGHVTVTNQLSVSPRSVVVVDPNGSLRVTGSIRNDGILLQGPAIAATGRSSQFDRPSFQSEIPQSLELKPNYPNPFNPTTMIEFSVPASNATTLKVYDIQGREIRTLFDETAEAGRSYRITFDGTGLASGTYLYALQSGEMRKVGKMTLQK